MLTPNLIPLSKIIDLPGNPKEHDLGAINSSVDRFGFLERVIINGETGHLIAGHGRIAALRSMKARGEPVPIGIESHDHEWLVPVDYVNLAEREEKAAAISLNRLVELGGWDEPLLAQNLSQLLAQGAEMLAGVGYDGDDVDALLRMVTPEPDIEAIEDSEAIQVGGLLGQAAALREKWAVERGAVYQAGAHILVCGDCREAGPWEQVCQALGVERLDGLFTSPPYAEQRAAQYGGVKETDYVAWWEAVQTQAAAHLAPNGSWFVNLKAHCRAGQRVLYVMDLVCAMVRQWQWQFVDEFAWLNPGVPGSWPNRFKDGWEGVYHFCRGLAPLKFRPQNVSFKSEGAFHWLGGMPGRGGGGGWIPNTARTSADLALPSNVIQIGHENTKGAVHPASFPSQLPGWFMRAFSDPGDVWLDMFGGSGSTLVAAEQAGRRGGLIEILPEYVGVALERLSLAGLQVEQVTR